MRRWQAAALRRLAPAIEECESGWELLERLAEDRPCDLVVASRSLQGFNGAQILAMLRSADVHVPFVLVAPFCDGSVRSLVQRSRNAALIEDSLDAVRLAEAAEALITSTSPREAHAEKVRRALALCARAPGPRRSRATG